MSQIIYCKQVHTVLNNTVLLSTKILLKLVDECQRYIEPKQCWFQDTVYSMTEKTISRVHVHVSPGSAETLVRRGVCLSLCFGWLHMSFCEIFGRF